MIRELILELVVFLGGTGFGLLLGRELRIYRAANSRGGHVDLTGRRP